ncbi:unnamed protein product [Amoebophrya sp. A120]|nr:unnamed protein product [Amoebophrya sp. A120]|eukprot:GSA120T00013648001.1
MGPAFLHGLQRGPSRACSRRSRFIFTREKTFGRCVVRSRRGFGGRFETFIFRALFEFVQDVEQTQTFICFLARSSLLLLAARHRMAVWFQTPYQAVRDQLRYKFRAICLIFSILHQEWSWLSGVNKDDHDAPDTSPSRSRTRRRSCMGVGLVFATEVEEEEQNHDSGLMQKHQPAAGARIIRNRNSNIGTSSRNGLALFLFGGSRDH